MILSYKARMAGPYHIKKNIVCQDAYYIRELENGTVIAAVADGLGSETHSDVAALIASNFVVNFCVEHYHNRMTDDEILALMKRAYTKAYMQVMKKANTDQNDIDQYDCTLCMAIYDGQKLWYGQSGDSGLIAALNDGFYLKVTEPQNDEDGNVYPLCFGPEYWDFGVVENVVSAMLMTDGVWHQIFPGIMKNEKQPMNIALAEMFMNRYALPPEEIKALEKSAFRFLENYDERLLDDDKTIVVLINTDAKPARREDSYYAEPDWDNLIKKRTEKLQGKKNLEDEAEPTAVVSPIAKVIQPIVSMVEKALHIDSKV